MTEKKATFTARFESLALIDALAAEAAATAGLDVKAVYGVEMAVDEACSNIIEHAYGGESDEVIEYTHEIKEDRLIITLRDYGEPFDPTCVAKPDLHRDVETRDVGGLGFFFMCQLMDEVSFEFSSDQGNLLTMVKHRPAAGNRKRDSHEDVAV